MQLEFAQDENKLIVKLSGNIRMENGVELRDSILGSIHKSAVTGVLLDFSAVSQVDSIGLGSLLSIYKALKGEQLGFGIFGLTPEVKKLFEITQLVKIIPVADNLQMVKQRIGDR